MLQPKKDEMKNRLFLLMVALVFGLSLAQAPSVHAANCACLDLDDDGACTGADTALLDSQWLAGAPFTTTEPFLVPAGCNYVFSTGIVTINGVKVTAPKITFNGVLHITKPGGQGIRMIATGSDGFTSKGGALKSGGVNGEFAPLKKRSVMIVAETGPCTFINASLEGVSPAQGTNVGVKCQQDVVLRGSKFIGALVNVRSVAGKIDASTAPIDICGQVPPAASLIASLNDPVILIAFLGLSVDNSEVIGKYRILAVSQTSDISTVNSLMHNGTTPPGGAHIAMFPHPTSVNFAQVDFEDVSGPSSGELDIDKACYESPQLVRVGQGATVTGTPDPAPCAQFPADFVFVLNATY